MRKLLNIEDWEYDPYTLYGGANGNKRCYKNDLGEQYLIKFPVRKKEVDNSYTNSCISEDIGCRIFASLGIDTQETHLATYKGKILCACKDFTDSNTRLYSFAELKNTSINSESNGFGVELSEVLDTIKDQVLIDPQVLNEYFWDMFIGDALIGNFDRHNGNWGFLINEQKHMVQMAPVFDCGSSLYPQMLDKNIEKILSNQNEIDNRVFVFPNSALKIDDKKINYLKFISSGENDECTASLKKIITRVDMNKINEIIDTTPAISEIRKTFYKTMLAERKEKILDKALELLLSKDKAKDVKQFSSIADRKKAAETEIKNKQANLHKTHKKELSK